MNQIGPEPHNDRPTVVSFGGGKGGVGRSTLCAETARSIARHGHRVLCLDASWACPTLNALLHAEPPCFHLGPHRAPLGHEDAHIADFIIPTNHTEIWLASVASARQFPFVRPRLGADQLLDQLLQLDFDWILVDLPAELDPFYVSLFTLADLPLLTCSPEPAAVRLSTQYLRAALYQAIGYHPDAHHARDEILDLLYSQPIDMNLDSLLNSTPDDLSRDIVLDTARRFEPYLVVNLVREGAERDLGHVLCHAWHRELHVFPRMLTSVDYEDRRWFYNRRTTGTGPSRGDEAFSSDTEALARQILDISIVDAHLPRPVDLDPDAHPALQLGIRPDTTRSEVRQHCRRLWEGYRRENTVGLVFSDPARRTGISQQLEKLYRRVLTMPQDRFHDHAAPSNPPHTLSTPQDTSSARPTGTPPPKSPTNDQSIAHPVAPSPAQIPQPTPASADHAHRDVQKLARTADSAGDLLTKLRRSRDMNLQELSLRTHIGIKYLAAIEDVELDVLPRTVYLRGYLREIARVFDIDAEPFIALYFQKLDQAP